MRELEKDKTERNLGKKHHKCGICGAEGMFDSYLVREMMQDSREEFEYFVCSECNCLQIAKIPQDLGRYYGEEYYSFRPAENYDFQDGEPAERQEKILDVGCGSGAWLLQKAFAGWGNLHGCDPFLEKELQYGDRVHIRKCSIHEMKEDGSFDLIRMSDSFEHMTDPLKVLQSACRLLKPKGILVMRIPIFPNIAFDMYGAHWYQIDAPRHIFLHSKRSLKYLEEQSGLKILEMEYDSNNSQIIRSFLYSMGIPFYEQTEGTLRCFSSEDIDNIEKYSESCNKMEYGDHVKVIWVRQDRGE